MYGPRQTAPAAGEAARALGRRLVEAAAAFGARPALRDLPAGRETAGAELARRADALEAALRALGLPAGAVVALAAPPGAEGLAAYLALLSAGLVPLELPLDWADSIVDEALRYAEPSALLVAPGAAGARFARWPEAARTVPAPDGWSWLAREGAIDCAAAEAVGLVFTGGTDGRLKAAVWSARGLEHVLTEVIAYLGQGPDVVTATALPWQHGYGKSVVLSSLLSGSTHCILPRGPLSEPLAASLARAGATSFSGVPVQYRLALRGKRLAGLGALRTACVAGGALRSDELELLAQAAPAAALFVMYGLTEMTTRVTYLPPEERPRRVGSCGRPLGGVSVRLGDGGELEVFGPNQMLGYWRRPAETAAATCPDGWLRTGDVAELDADGFVYLKGRSKNLLKKSGAVLYPQLLEDLLRRHLACELAVVGVPDHAGEDRLCVFVAGSPAPAAAEIKAAALRALGPAYLPDLVAPLAELPLSPAGKVRLDELRRVALALLER